MSFLADHRRPPGQLFELRTAGNIVPPYPAEDRPTGEAATIEYALRMLQVRDIIVCGHSHCGAVGAILRGDDLSTMPAVRHWLARCTDGRTPPADAGDLPGAVQAHALAQLDTLRGYPAVRERIADGSSVCTPGTTKCTPAPSASTGPNAGPSSPAFDGFPPHARTPGPGRTRPYTQGKPS